MAFSWSYTKLTGFETCPRRYYEVTVAKNYSDGEGEALVWGNQVHKALANSCENGADLPIEMLEYKKWVNTVRAMPGELKVEQKYAITNQFQPAAWFGGQAWYRGIADVVRIDDKRAIALDWKTGKPLTDYSQLMLMSQCLFTHYPKLETVTTAYIWLKNDSMTPHEYTRQDVANEWVGLLTRVAALENAHIRQEFAPKPGKLCRSWCPVLSCPHHGKGVAR